MVDQCRSKIIKNKIYSVQEDVYKNSLKEQCFEIELWEMRINMISNLRNKELQNRNEKIIEMVCSCLNIIDVKCSEI